MRSISSFLSVVAIISSSLVTASPFPLPQAAATSCSVTAQPAGQCWVVYQSQVYDFTSWLTGHPGGSGPLKAYCGQSGTGLETAFKGKHGSKSFSSSGAALACGGGGATTATTGTAAGAAAGGGAGTEYAPSGRGGGGKKGKKGGKIKSTAGSESESESD